MSDLRDQIGQVLAEWASARMTVCEHTQLIEFGAAVDGILAVLTPPGDQAKIEMFHEILRLLHRAEQAAAASTANTSRRLSKKACRETALVADRRLEMGPHQHRRPAARLRARLHAPARNGALMPRTHTIEVATDVSRLAATLEIVSKHAAACAAELRALQDPETDGNPGDLWPC